MSGGDSSPYARLSASIPVSLTTTPISGTTGDDIAILTLGPPRHQHPIGSECPACAAQTDIRALLFDLLQSARQGQRPPFTRVVVDASALPDPTLVLDRLLPGKVPALGLRDHTVAQNFHLVPAGRDGGKPGGEPGGPARTAVASGANSN